ncbi:MAG: tetratricopeptide repeat protein [Acidobacteria bacterium]|nr:tetratricopeptide repeat protein [Acidobacteriota bacterium]
MALVAAAVVAVPKRWQRWAAGAAGLVGVAAAMWWRLAQHPDSLAWFRFRIWGAVTRLVMASPIVGVGPGGLADAAGVVRLPTRSLCALHGYRILYAESSVLGWAVQTGVVGLILAAAALWVWGHRASSSGGLSAPSSRAMVVAMLVVLLLHDLLQINVVLWWWALVLGGTVPLGMRRRRPVRSPRRVEQGLAAVVIAGVVLWGMVQPGLARNVGVDGTSPRAVDRALMMEPWLDRPALARADDLLRQGLRWSWEVAGEAQERAEAALAVHAGSAVCWATVGRVNARIVTDLGGWPSAVARAREAFARASSLEPELPWYWLDWARLERALGRTGRARELVTRATQAEPRCVPAWLLLARVELDGGRPAAARAAYAQAAEARQCGRGRLLSDYERALLEAPSWQWRSLEASLR